MTNWFVVAVVSSSNYLCVAAATATLLACTWGGGDRCPNGKRPIQITSGGRKRINELRPGGRMSPSNIVRWDAIHR